MAGATHLERLLRRERMIVAAGLLALALLAWTYVLGGAGMSVDMREAATLSLFPHKAPAAAAPMAGMDMGGMDMGGMDMPGMDMPGMDMGGASDEGRPAWAVAFAMWAAMMVAMMTPSAAPAILLYGRVRAQAEATRGSVGIAPVGVFAAGYLLVWVAFSVVAAALHGALEAASLLSPADMGSESKWLSAAVLVGAGGYQLTPVKRACLAKCRSPAQFLSRHWRPGAAGAVRLGLLHGAYCVGCCWVLMALLFVGGVMNLAWIAALTLLVAAEKLLPIGPWVARGTGAALIVWGFATLVV